MATRNFILTGNLYQPLASGTIKINGVEVFNGNFPTSPVWTEGEGLIVLASGSFDDNNDSNTPVVVPVEISLNSGSIGVGLMKFNNATRVRNPIYTPEQFATLTGNTASVGDKTTIEASVATPSFASDELTTLNLVSTDPAILAQKKAILRNHNAWWYVSDAESYAESQGDILNRSDATVNGSPVATPLNESIALSSGDLLIFDQTIFATVI